MSKDHWFTFEIWYDTITAGNSGWFIKMKGGPAVFNGSGPHASHDAALDHCKVLLAEAIERSK